MESSKFVDRPNIKNGYMYIETLESFIDVIYKEIAEQKILGIDIENSNKSYEGYISLI